MRVIVVVLALAALTATSLPATAAEGASRGINHISVVGDLDGDGRQDTVGVESNPPEYDTPVAAVGGRETVLTARRGSDGSTLWQRELAAASFVTGANIGADGRRGVLVVDGPMVGGAALLGGVTASSNGGAGALAVDNRPLKLTALDGKTGAIAWTRTFEGGPMAGAAGRSPDGQTGQILVAENYTAFVGAVAGATADRFLITFVTRRDTPAGITSTNKAIVISGTDGADATTVTLTSEGTRPVARAAGDLDDDGLGDFVFIRTGGNRGIDAFSGASGERLWNNADVAVGNFAVVEQVGDLTGDGRDDIIVSGDAETTPTTATHLIDGATGSVRVTSPASLLTPVGDTTGDGRSELVASTSGEDSAAYQLVDVDGNVITGASHGVDAPEGVTDVFLSTAGAIGDVNHDGITDVAHVVSYRRNGVDESHRAIVSGRTLNLIRSQARGTPLPLSTGAGHGDFFDVSLTGQAFALALTAGESGSTKWSRSFDSFLADATSAQLYATAADVTGDGVPDVIANVQLSKPTCAVAVPDAGCAFGPSTDSAVRTYVLSGTNGALVWQA